MALFLHKYSYPSVDGRWSKIFANFCPNYTHYTNVQGRGVSYDPIFLIYHKAGPCHKVDLSVCVWSVLDNFEPCDWLVWLGLRGCNLESRKLDPS